MKKILIITQHFYPENFRFNDLALGLIEKGNDVDVLTGVPNYPQGDFFKGYKILRPFIEKWNGVRIIRAPLIPRKNSKFFLALNYFSFPIFATFLSVFFLKKRYDAVLVCQSSPIFMAIPANLRRLVKKEPTYLWITDLWPESLRATNTIHNPFLLNGIEKVVKYVYENVDHILISCKGFEKSIRDKNLTTPISYFPYWAETFYKPIKPEPLPNMPPGLKLIFAGNIGKAQGLDVLVKAASVLKEEDIKYVMIGDGRDIDSLKATISKYGMGGKFYFLGSHPSNEMPKFFAHCDALFLSLRKDPIFEITVPSKVQSYLACGKPILASIDGEAARLIEESGAGYTAPAEDHLELAEIILKFKTLLEKEREEMGKRAFQFFEENFERTKLLDFIDNLISQK